MSENICASESKAQSDQLPSIQQILFVQVGVGCDQHGQNITKAAVRAARQAIEFNSIPSINAIVPGGYANMLVKIDIAAPPQYHDSLDLEAVKAVFPYGEIIGCDLQPGGAIFRSGIAIADMGDTSEDMLIVNVAVTVGY